MKRSKFQHKLSTITSIRALLGSFESDYVLLLQRLSGRLGSREAAVEALHDTYIKLRSRPEIGQVKNPRAYLYRMAMNLAKNRRRNEARIVPFAIAAFLDLPDTAPSQDRAIGAEQAIKLAVAALRSQSIKRQEIFLAKWRDDKSQAEIAADFGMHKRSVQKELAKAEAFVRATLRSTMAL
ncbi:RNA polymerase sigma factor [Novosphingobium sp. AP12]|uniref:RNA polymerase sigma factor n=1 Tax=Novosphingobium sp. AP12 TaxID=1144305 RepID=UPI001930BBD8|nr:sigma-70 family RNA polymerase sigma factor [Novosphingobium sp. AP12]